MPVFADDQGVVRFAAAPAQIGDPVTELLLDCSDDTTSKKTFPIDLTAASTFGAATGKYLSVAHLRPALSGAQLQLSQEYLSQHDYGIRPDPAQVPGAYSAWVEAVSAPARRINTKDVPTRFTSGTKDLSSWSGGELTNDYYEFVAARFVVPTVPLGPTGGLSIWAGLGGDDGHKDLIQTGVQIETIPIAASAFAWKEYFSGDDVGGDGYVNEKALFPVAQGDSMYVQAFACDGTGSGDVEYSGGYGCFLAEDLTTAVYKVCDSPSGSCPSLQQINAFVGATAESILEKNTIHLSDFDGATMTKMVAYSATTGYQVNYGSSGTNTESINMVPFVGSMPLATGQADNPSPDGTTFVFYNGG